MPKYDYRCKVCGAVEEVLHGFEDEPDMHCMECGALMGKLMGMPYVSPSAVPSRNNVIDFDATRQAEKDKDADMAAYKRLRKDGVQPPSINGSAKLEAKAEEKHEVNSGHTFATATGRKRGMGLVRDALGET
jgi:putative FmdB family regulatory protein